VEGSRKRVQREEKVMLETLGKHFGREFEITLCYILLFDQALAEQFADAVSPDLFRDPQHREIISSFNRLRRAAGGSVPTYKTVLAELRRKRSDLDKNSPRYKPMDAAVKRLVTISNRPASTASDVGFVRDNLQVFVTKRSTQLALLESVELVETGEFDQIRDIIDAATQSGRLKVAPTLGLEFTDAEARYARYTAKKLHTIHSPIGVPRLDAMMRGGLEPGSLGMFMAATGIGKTMAMINVGTAALLRGLNVVHFTMEIFEDEVSIRYDARMLGYPINELMRNPKRYKKRMKSSNKNLKSRLFIKQWGSDEVSAYDLRAYLKVLDLKEGVKPQVLLVDYADLLCPLQKQREVRFELRDTVRALRQIASEFNCAVWTASQVNKEGFDAEILSLRTISESSEKANVADVVIGLCQTADERRKKRMRLLILKNRLGGNEQKAVDCIINTGTQTISENPTQISTIGKKRSP